MSALAEMSEPELCCMDGCMNVIENQEMNGVHQRNAHGDAICDECYYHMIHLVSPSRIWGYLDNYKKYKGQIKLRKKKDRGVKKRKRSPVLLLKLKKEKVMRVRDRVTAEALQRACRNFHGTHSKFLTKEELEMVKCKLTALYPDHDHYEGDDVSTDQLYDFLAGVDSFVGLSQDQHGNPL